MKYDREWLSQIHDFERASKYFFDNLRLQLPVPDRFHLTKAYDAVVNRFRADMHLGHSVADSWQQITQLVSLAEDLIEEDTARWQQYGESSSQAQGT